MKRISHIHTCHHSQIWLSVIISWSWKKESRGWLWDFSPTIPLYPKGKHLRLYPQAYQSMWRFIFRDWKVPCCPSISSFNYYWSIYSNCYCHLRKLMSDKANVLRKKIVRHQKACNRGLGAKAPEARLHFHSESVSVGYLQYLWKYTQYPICLEVKRQISHIPGSKMANIPYP